jgi:hypothetical protein
MAGSPVVLCISGEVRVKGAQVQVGQICQYNGDVIAPAAAQRVLQRDSSGWCIIRMLTAVPMYELCMCVRVGLRFIQPFQCVLQSLLCFPQCP